MKYSIIIAVYNRLGEVIELLQTAEKLSVDRNIFEIIFVDDGSKDGFRDFIETYKTESGLNIRAVYQENKGPGEARNHGMSVAKGDYFIFVDSDCLFPPQWLEVIDNDISIYGYAAFGGPDTCHADFSPLLKAINYSMTSFIGTGGTRGNKKHIGRFYPRSFNMGISREVFAKIGGMGKLRHGQDMDYSQRIYDAGFSVGLIDKAYIYHKRRTSIPKFYRQIFNWGVARINLSRRHPSMLKPIHLLPALLVMGLISLFLISPILPRISSFMWILISFFFLGICIFAFVQSLYLYKNIKASLLSILILNIQVFAYGLGLIHGMWYAARGKETSGFSKNYYGK